MPSNLGKKGKKCSYSARLTHKEGRLRGWGQSPVGPALWANLHFISNLEEMARDGEVTVDGCHPNDCGMKRMGEAFGRKYREILGLGERK